jgi:putative colanic acid biosynthesis UDP-glucose lipid carrier transferase
MNRRFIHLLRISFIFLDLLALNLVFGIQYLLFNSRIAYAVNPQYYTLWVLVNLAWLATAWISSMYQGSFIASFETFSRHTMYAYIYFVAAMSVYLFFFRRTEISRWFLISFLLSDGFSLLLNRVLYLVIHHFFRNKEYLLKKVLIIGYNHVSKKLASRLEASTNIRIVGFYEKESNINELTHYPVLSHVNDLFDKQHQPVNEIYSTVAPEQDHRIYQIMQQADDACIRFKLVPDLSYFIRQPVHVEYLDDLPVLSLRNEPLDDVGNRIRKRLFDIIVSTMVILLVLSWLTPLLAILLWLDSRGPVFFSQERTGVNNQPFICLKFRSMRVNKEANIRQATQNDNRVTRLGRFLRRTSIDELPQFFNVLMSDMSIVGPRPHMLRHTEDYSRIINKYMVRQFLKPGITGWAQINGFRGEMRKPEDMKGRVEHDLWYMENWSLWLDVKIVFLTFFGMIKGDKNAY